jgi:hypothetical protein
LLARLDALPPGKRPYLHTLRARFRARIGNDPADPLFAEAEQTLARLERPFDLAVIQLEHAEWLISEERADEAEPLLEAARATFEQLEAKPWLQRPRDGRAAPTRACSPSSLEEWTP